MRWLRRLLGEPPEPRGLYTVPSIPPPVPREVAEGRRGTHVFPEIGLPADFQPPNSIGQPACEGQVCHCPARAGAHIHQIIDAPGPRPVSVGEKHNPGPESMMASSTDQALSAGALREALIAVMDLGGAWGQNLGESKDVLVQVGDDYRMLSQVKASFRNGRFVLVLEAGSPDSIG